MIGLLAQGAGWGFTAGTLPGPLLSYLVSTTLTRGWRRGILVIFAPLISDLPIIVVMTFLLSGLSPAAERILYLVGGAYVLRLAWLAWGDYRAGTAISAESGDTPATPRQTLARAVSMNVLNPNPYIFWSVVTGPVLRDALAVSVVQAAAFVASFYATFLALMAVWVIAFDRLRQVDERVTRGLLLLAIGFLAAFGLRMLLRGAFDW